jgi:hypothetical protein
LESICGKQSKFSENHENCVKPKGRAVISYKGEKDVLSTHTWQKRVSKVLEFEKNIYQLDVTGGTGICGPEVKQTYIPPYLLFLLLWVLSSGLDVSTDGPAGTRGGGRDRLAFLLVA